MEVRIREIYVFTIRLESEKIARNSNQIQRIFAMFEKFEISFECIAVNIDWLSVIIRISEQNKVSGLLLELCGKMPGVNISTQENLVLLSVEGMKLDCRKVGMLMSSLALQNVDVQMLRQVKKDRLVVGISITELDRVKSIIQEELVYVGNRKK